MDRVIALIDMDCFFAQVEQRLCPELWGKPVAVIQNGVFRGGGIIALSYEARDRGVMRGMYGDEALRNCPELHLARVPKGEHAEKADLTRYRDASAEIHGVLNTFDERIVVERASVDEAFLDLTTMVDEILAQDGEDILDRIIEGAEEFLPTTHVATGEDIPDNEEYDRNGAIVDWLGSDCRQDRIQLRLAVGAKIVEQIRKRILERTQFFCSAGVGTNKIIAKLVCARHKPRQQTVIPPQCITEVFKQIPITKVWSFGGKLGESLVDTYKIKTMFELSQIPRSDLEREFPHHSDHIFNLAKGINHEAVKVRDKQKSLAVSKNFPGKASIRTIPELKKWLLGLVKELSKRLTEDQRKNVRTAHSLNCGFVMNGPHGKTIPLHSYLPEAIFNSVWNALKQYNQAADPNVNWEPPIVNVFLSASRFRDGVTAENQRITQWVCKKIEDLEGRTTHEDVDEGIVCLNDDNSIDIANFDSNSRWSTMEEAKPDVIVEPVTRMGSPQPSTSSAALSSSVVHRPAANSAHFADTEFDFSFLPPTFEEVDADYFANMPESVQRGIRHHYQIKTAKEMERKKRGEAPSKASKKSAKRPPTKKNSQFPEPPAPKISKISSFFKPK